MVDYRQILRISKIKNMVNLIYNYIIGTFIRYYSVLSHIFKILNLIFVTSFFIIIITSLIAIPYIYFIEVGKYLKWDFIYIIERTFPNPLEYLTQRNNLVSNIFSIIIILGFPATFFIYSRIFGKIFKPNFICSKFLIFAKNELENKNFHSAIRFILNSIDLFPPRGFYTLPYVIGEEILNFEDKNLESIIIYETKARLTYLKQKLKEYISIIILDPSNKNIENISKNLEKYAEIIQNSKYTKINGKIKPEESTTVKTLYLIQKYFIQIMISIIASLIPLIIF